MAHYRASLDALESLAPGKPVLLRVEMARQAHARTRDWALATREATLAKHDAEVLLGEIEEEAGRLEAAKTRYLDALAAARRIRTRARRLRRAWLA